MIFIRPTMRGKVMITAALISLAVAFINASLTICMASAALSAIVLASFILSFLSLYRVELQRGPMRDGTAGSSMMMPVIIRNLGGSRRQALVIREECPYSPEKIINTAIAPLFPGERRVINRVVWAARRGHYLLEKISVAGGDPAGLFSRTRDFKLPCDIMVYPESVKLSWMPIRIKKQIQASNAGRPLGISGIGNEFFGVREYRPCDGVRYIHWKSTAKHKKLMVREFEANSITRVNIVLDVESGFIGGDEMNSNFEYLVKTAASITNYLAGNFCQIIFVTGYNNEVMRISGEAFSVKNRIMTALATLTPLKLNFLEVLDADLDYFRSNSILYCLSMSEPDKISNRFDKLLDRGVDVRWIYAPGKCFSTFPFESSVKSRPGEKKYSGYSGIIPYVAARETNIPRMLMYG